MRYFPCWEESQKISCYYSRDQNIQRLQHKISLQLYRHRISNLPFLNPKEPLVQERTKEIPYASLSECDVHFRILFIRPVCCYTLLGGFQLPWPPPSCLYEQDFFTLSYSISLSKFMIDLTLSSTLTALRPTSYFSYLSVKHYLIDAIQWEFDESVIDHSASSIPQYLYRLEYTTITAFLTEISNTTSY